MRASRGTVPRLIARIMFGSVRLRKANRFEPDIFLEDGDDLSAYGIEGRVLHLPGHSRGSIGILTSEGALFCGDLLGNTRGPVLNTLVDDPAAARASLQRLRSLDVSLVYPGHGEPFPLALLETGASTHQGG